MSIRTMTFICFGILVACGIVVAIHPVLEGAWLSLKRRWGFE